MSDAERFMAKVNQGSLGQCWEWTASRSTDGYGLFWIRGKMRRAHRVALQLAGRPLADDEVVDHTCRNRLCVNPAHLQPATRFENVHQNSEALAHLNSLKSECLRGHPLFGANLYVKRNGKRQCRTCERERVAKFRFDAKHESAAPKVDAQPLGKGETNHG